MIRNGCFHNDKSSLECHFICSRWHFQDKNVKSRVIWVVYNLSFYQKCQWTTRSFCKFLVILSVILTGLTSILGTLQWLTSLIVTIFCHLRYTSVSLHIDTPWIYHFQPLRMKEIPAKLSHKGLKCHFNHTLVESYKISKFSIFWMNFIILWSFSKSKIA